MKKLMIAAGVVVLLAGRASAWWEVKDNPDRFISFGVNTGNSHFSGTTNNLLNPNQSNETVQGQTKSGNLGGYGFDVRFPFAKYVTFTASWDRFHLDSELIREANTFQNHDNINGTSFNIGARFYLAN